MPNGKPGDHPLTDILVHESRVYSDSIDDLIRQINRLGGRRNLEELDLFDHFNSNSITAERRNELERILTTLAGELGVKARESGWEAD